MKCYSSGYGDDFFRPSERKCLGKERNISFYKGSKRFKAQLSNCQEMKWLSAFSVLEFDFEMTVNIHVWKI